MLREVRKRLLAHLLFLVERYNFVGFFFFYDDFVLVDGIFPLSLCPNHEKRLSMRSRVLSVLLALCVGLPIYAQPYCSVKTFNLRDGLASNVITGMQQSEDGLMWLSTWSGLAAYDGYKFTSYHEQDVKGGKERTRVLTTNRLLTIKPNAAGNIWCITYDLHAWIYDRRENSYVDILEMINQRYGISLQCNGVITLKNGHTYLLSVNEGPLVRINDHRYESEDAIEIFYPDEGWLAGRGFNWIYEDNDGGEWMITSKGVRLMDTGWSTDTPYSYVQQVGKEVYLVAHDGRVGCLDKQTDELTSLMLPEGVTNAWTPVSDGETLVVPTNLGLWAYDTKKQAGRLLSLPGLAMKDNGKCYMDSRKRLWMVEAGGTSILQVNLQDGSVARLSLTDKMPKLIQSDQTFVHEDIEGTVWIATEAGFFGFYDEKENRMCSYTIRNKATEPHISRWYIDTQGNLWYSNNHNLARLQFKYRHIRHIPDSSEVRSLCYDKEGYLWIGYRSGVLARYAPGGILEGYLGFDGRLHKNKVALSTHIYGLLEDSRGRLWIGTKGDGLYLREVGGQMRHFLNVPDDSLSLGSNQVYAIHEDRQGRIWLGTFEAGICLVEEDAAGKVSFVNAANGLSNYPIENFHKVRRITETDNGVIVVSCSNGMVAFDSRFETPEKIKFHAYKHVRKDEESLLSSDVMQTLVSSDGTIYVATVGGGLQTMSGDNLLTGNLRLKDVSHLVRGCGIIFGLQEDREGNIWIGCENSLNMLDVKKGRVWCFGPTYLGEDTRLAEALPVYNPVTDEMAMATSSGSITLTCSKLQEEEVIPSLSLGTVSYHNEESEVQHTLLGDTLVVSPDQKDFTVSFAAIDFQDNHMIRYAYKLVDERDEASHEWNQLGTERSISFNNIPHGRYRLMVRSTNAYGAWVENTETLHIHVLPTFWESTWGVALQLLVLLAVACIAGWLYRRRVRERMERNLDTMKLEFFTDVSHKLRTPLTLIGGPVTQVLEAGGLTDGARHHLEMVERNAKRMLELVDKMLIYSKTRHLYISDESAQQESVDGALSASTATPETLADEMEENPKPRLLIVEDNDDLRAFLASILESEYDITRACDGQEGLEKAREQHPDFILTDVMMPRMDGLAMVRCIKEDKETSHIPIVILSAKASMDDRIEGLKLGVSDYITKPFSATYLKQRMANIISNRRMLQQSYLEQIKQLAATAPVEDTQTIRLTATNIVDSDKLMMEKLLAYIDENMANPNLRIEDLAFAVCLGRTVFYNKVRTLVGMSPVELLRQIRIQRAEDMVAKSNEPFSRIAYSVGFSDPRYFGKCFKQQTGLTPSEYRESSQMKSVGTSGDETEPKS